MALPFSASTQSWVPYLASLDDGAHGGMGFLQAWLQKESDGNACSWTPYGEAGIWQLMPGDNQHVAHTTPERAHPSPPCTPGKQTNGISADDLTAEQIQNQIEDGTNYLNYCIDNATSGLSAGQSTIDMSMSDFWQFVKLSHGAPAWAKHGPSMYLAENGAPVTSWDAFETWARGHGCWGSAHCDQIMTNARSVGAYGGGSPSPSIIDQLVVLAGPPRDLSVKEIVLAGIFAVGAFFAAQRASRYLFGRAPV